MNYAIITNGQLTGFIVNTNSEDAERIVKRRNAESTLIRVFLKNDLPGMFRSCTFGPEFSKLKWFSRIWLWFKGVDCRALAFSKKWD